MSDSDFTIFLLHKPCIGFYNEKLRAKGKNVQIWIFLHVIYQTRNHSRCVLGRWTDIQSKRFSDCPKIINLFLPVPAPTELTKSIVQFQLVIVTAVKNKQDAGCWLFSNNVNLMFNIYSFKIILCNFCKKAVFPFLLEKFTFLIPDNPVRVKGSKGKVTI